MMRRLDRLASPLGWSIAGALLGVVAGLVAFAPASGLARAVDAASSGHLLISDTRGTVWSGSGVLVLTGGAGSRDASALPGRVRWSLGVQGLGLLLKARQDCCIRNDMQWLLKPGWGRFELVLVNSAATGLAQWPASWLAGLGTPWNTVQLGGSLRLAARDFRLEWVQGRWRQFGQMEVDLLNLSSRISTVDPMGSYRFTIAADPANTANAGVSVLTLSTQEGALLLTGQGSLSNGRARFQGEAAAAPGFDAALNNLLNIIGRREGARSVISIG
jgi:general secretion pathway protein N